MFTGEDVSAIVVDIGSNTIKAGFAGDEAPKAVYPSHLGVIAAPQQDGASNNVGGGDVAIAEASAASNKYFVGEGVSYRRDFMEVKSPLKDGLITEWDYIEPLLEHGFSFRLNSDPKEHPVLMAEVPFNTPQNREKMVSLLFEKFQVPAAYLSKNPVLSAFANGKSSALVVDSGASMTCVTPVWDGWALTKAMTRCNHGGDWASEKLLRLLETQRGIPLKPRYMFNRKQISTGQFAVSDLDNIGNTTQSFKHYMQISTIVNDIKESLFKISETTHDDAQNAHMPTVSYELPDGNTIDIGPERYTIPEAFFTPSAIAEKSGRGKGAMSVLSEPMPADWVPIHLLAYDSVVKCDADMRREMYNTTILTGGNSLIPGFAKRFEKELTAKAPQAMKVKTPTASNLTPTERKYSVWIGGSILASLGTFQQMWISKQEYEESGASIVNRKCP